MSFFFCYNLMKIGPLRSAETRWLFELFAIAMLEDFGVTVTRIIAIKVST
jgi:hypothetical protein